MTDSEPEPEPEPGEDKTDLSDGEYVSNLTRGNAERLTTCVESLANQIERLDDPAVFRATLNRYTPVE